MGSDLPLEKANVNHCPKTQTIKMVSQPQILCQSHMKFYLLLPFFIFALNRDFTKRVCTVLTKFPAAITIRSIPQVTTYQEKNVEFI